MTALNWIDWTVILAYSAIVVALGFSFARGHKSTDEYFVGDRRMNWFAVGLSIFAAAFSALSFVLLPREGAFRNGNFLTALLFIPLVITPLLCSLGSVFGVRASLAISISVDRPFYTAHG